MILKSLPPGGDTAAFWIDLVIKYGGKHLRPHAQDMIWYEYLMLDILLVVMLIVILEFVAMYKVFSKVYRRAAQVKKKSD